MDKDKKNYNIPINIKHQYIKDLSFENPILPKGLSFNSEPKVSLDVEINFLNLTKDDHELTLIFKSEGKIKNQTLFILELHYSCIVHFNYNNDEDMKKKAIIECSHLLFPFARSIIANLTRDGGFNPLIIQPIEFEKLYRE